MKPIVISSFFGVVLNTTAAEPDLPPERVLVLGQQSDAMQQLEDVLPYQPIGVANGATTDSLAHMLAQHPQVNLNGQGGLFQTLSIRGLSRWRVQTRVEGVPIHTERRAGSAAEFLAPQLVERMHLLSGPASTQLGSGALGGGLDISLIQPGASAVTLSAGLAQTYRGVQLQGSSERQQHSARWHWAVNGRDAQPSETASGERLADQFTQGSVLLRRTDSQGPLVDALLLYTQSRDIGKATAEPPQQRQTLYPQNDHWLGSLQFDWLNARVYAHQSELQTDILRPQVRRNLTHNEALNWGMSVGDQWQRRDWRVFWGVQLDARNGVEARERQMDASGNLMFERPILRGRQQEWAATATAVRTWQTFTLSAGARLSYLHQRGGTDQRRQTQSDTNASGFVALRQTWPSGISLAATLSSAYRVPTLTERYFDGSTPRGEVRGDPQLTTETSTSVTLSARYQDQDWLVEVELFEQALSNYIERIAVNDTLLQYRNLGDVDIAGLSYQARWQFLPHWQLTWSGQWLSDADDTGQAVNDISPHQHRLQLGGQWQQLEGWLAVTYRQGKPDPGSAELPLERAAWLSLGASWQASSKDRIELTLSNLNNQRYRVSADALAPFARERDIQLRWRRAF